MPSAGPRTGQLLALVLCCPALLGAGPGRERNAEDKPVADPLRSQLAAVAGKVVLPARCGECHNAEFETWKRTNHATGFDTLHRSARSREISDNLGLRLTRRSSGGATPVCLSCHYTPTLRRGQLRAGAGVSCESCHGPAKGWISIHSSYGVATADFQEAARLETAGHRARRIADSTAAGMRRSSQMYELAATCFRCHTVPNEELVNRGGHSTGSEFELVEWNGLIRHNFLESYLAGDGRTNAERPRDLKRIMYVLGRALDVEYALRGIGAATAEGPYLAAQRERLGAALDALLDIGDRVDVPELRRIAGLAEAVELAPADFPPLGAADAVRTATLAFIAAADGAMLAPLDPLWDGDAAEPAPPGRITRNATIRGGDRAPFDGGFEPTAPATADTGSKPDAMPAAETQLPPRYASASPARTAAAAPVADPPPVMPLTRPPWRDPPQHDFVRVPCGRCHKAQLEWWRGDPHSDAARPLRQGDLRAVEIAAAYGVAAEDMARGAQTCMWCHGTVVSSPARRVRAGVGCQRCHGAGADYLGPHETASHAESVKLGLTDLRSPRVQATTCSGCHYITAPGLINAGHPSGADFDIVSRKSDIVHWGTAFGRERNPVDPGALRGALADVLAARGPVPVRAPIAPRIASPGDGSRVRTSARHPDGPAAVLETGQGAAQPGRTDFDNDAGPDVPADGEPSWIETTLDTIRRHIDQLYRALGLTTAEE